MTKKPSWKTGNIWKDGKHYHFGLDAITVTQGWPGLRVWTKTEGSPWRGTRFGPLDFSLFDPKQLELTIYKLELQARMRPELNPFPLSVEEFAYLMEQRALLSLVKTIPPDALKRVLPFWQRRWHLLCLQARVPGADDLLDSNPVLGWMLANHWVFRDGKGKSDATRVARRWVGKRQRDILDWLGFESSDGSRRIIARISPRHVSPQNLLYLRNALHLNDVKEAMQHQPTFTADTLRMVTDPALLDRVTPNLLREVTEKSMDMAGPYSSWKLRNLLALEKTYGFRLPRRIRGLKELDELERKFEHNRPLTQHAYPPAPWPGTPGIEPITNSYALQREGEEMHHCAAGYDFSVVDGSTFFYKVSQPVRATLAVRKKGKAWKLHELAGAFNERIDRPNTKEIWRRLTGTELVPSKSAAIKLEP